MVSLVLLKLRIDLIRDGMVQNMFDLRFNPGRDGLDQHLGHKVCDVVVDCAADLDVYMFAVYDQINTPGQDVGKQLVPGFLWDSGHLNADKNSHIGHQCV